MHYKKHALIIVLMTLTLLLSSCSFIGQVDDTKGANKPGVQKTALQSKPTISIQDIHTLKDAALNAQKRRISIGTAANIEAFHNDVTYKTVLGREFDLLVAENVMKMDITHPNIDTFDYTQSDELVSFAKEHSMQIEGANLIWSNQVPAWFAHGGYNRDELLGIMKDYIMNVVGHYKGKIQSWIIVNEPLDANEAGQKSIWEQTIGPDYIDYAFRWAHEADPQAKLFINDYNVEKLGDQSDRYYSLIQTLLKRKVPIDGIGFEDHLDISIQYTYAELVENMQRFADLGLEIRITEADIRLQNSKATPPEKSQQQAQLYADVVHACQEVKLCDSIILWGFTDKYTWIPEFTHNPDQPLIFDAQYNPKPAYDAIKEALFRP